MTCGKVILSENNKKHMTRKHNGEAVNFKFYNDSKQTKLCFNKGSSGKDLNSNCTTSAKDDSSREIERSSVGMMESTIEGNVEKETTDEESVNMLSSEIEIKTVEKDPINEDIVEKII